MTSHIETVEKHLNHQPPTEGLILNELADAAATTATDQFGTCALRIAADKKQLKEAYCIAKRLGTIEAEVWRSQPARKHYDPDHSKLRIKQSEAVKRKLEQACLNTQEEHGHRTYPDANNDKWTRCHDCTGMAHAGNFRYWIEKTCNKRHKQEQSSVPYEIRRYREFVASHPVEHFRLDVDDSGH